MCSKNKISLKPYYAISHKARRRYNRSCNKALNGHEHRAIFGTKFFLNTRVKVLTILDKLQESVQICHGCRDELETSCRKSISHHAKPSVSLTLKIRKRCTELYDVFCEAQGLQARANIDEALPANEHKNCGICVKCDSIISINRDLIDRTFEEIEDQAADQSENDSVLELPLSNTEILGVQNSSSTELSSETFQVCRMSTEDKSNNQSENSVYCRHILHNIGTALGKSLHCQHCKRNVKATALAFKKLYKSPSLKQSFINLQQCDAQILKSLNIFYSERLSTSLALHQCFKCEKSLDLTGGGPTSDELSSDFTSGSESDVGLGAEEQKDETEEQKGDDSSSSS